MLSTKEFNKLLNTDNINLSVTDMSEVKECLERYPYFESLRFIYLKYLYFASYDLFRQELQKSVVLINDREKLFYYIYSDDFSELLKSINNSENVKNSTSELINAFFETIGEKTDDILDIEKHVDANIGSMDYFTYLEYEKKHKQKNRECKLNLTRDDDLISDNIENEIQIIQEEDDDIITLDNIYEQVDGKNEKAIIDPIFNIEELSSLEDIKVSKIAPMRGQEIIDNFLEKEYIPLEKLQKKQLENDSDFDEEAILTPEEKSKDEGEAFFTETLSKIYIKQQRYEKAYEIIKHLSLNYPRKNVYFAEQLDFLEKLILNSKYNKK